MQKTRATRACFETLEQRHLLAADVAVEFRHLPDAFFPGRHQTYELRVTNRGDEDASGVRVVHETDLENLRWKVIRNDVRPNGIAVTGLNSSVPAEAMGIGDFNGDGIEDFAVGDWPVNNAGAVYVVFGDKDFGGVDLRQLDGVHGFTLSGPRMLGMSESIGSSLATADVNGDGVDDLLVGSRRGDARVILGGQTNGPTVQASGEAGFKVQRASSLNLGIRFVSSAGDFNRDGIEDFALAHRDTVYVIYGGENIQGDMSLAGISESVGISFQSDSELQFASLANVGDVNADGMEDLAFARTGETFILFGGREWSHTRNTLGSNHIEHGVILSTPGESYRPIKGGDFNGDGIHDAVFVGPHATHVLFGSQGLNQTNLIGLGDQFAETKLALGHSSLNPASVIVRDINADGLSDLVFGHSAREGAVVDVVFGAADSSADFQVTRLFTNTDNTTMRVSGLGDIDQDGSEELWFQALGLTPSVQIIDLLRLHDRIDRPRLSGTDKLDLSMDVSAGSELVFRVGAKTPITHAGEVVSAARVIPSGGDVNQAHNAEVHLALMRPHNELNLQVTPPAPRHVLPGSEVSYTFSVTNDGTTATDVTIHDPATTSLENVTWTRTTEAFSANHFLSKVVDPDPRNFYFRDWLKEGITLDGHNGYVLEGRLPVPVSSDETYRSSPPGRSVSARGDVNGDGRDDIAVGNRGEVLIKFGSPGETLGRLRPEELTGDVGVLVTGFRNDYWAARVEIVGDVNSDGMDDALVAAAPRRSGDYEFYVVFGQAAYGQGVRVDQLNGTDGFRIRGLQPATSVRDEDHLRLAGGGDLNGDGVDDLVLATPKQVVALFGDEHIGSNGILEIEALNGSNGFRASRTTSESAVPGDIAAGGDLNVDGVDDFAVIQEDDVLVLFGQRGQWPAQFRLDEPDPGKSLQITGVRPGSVDMGADVNGDGIDDLLVGSAIDPSLGIYRDPGSAHVLLGAPNLADLGSFDLSVDYGLKIAGGGSHSADMLGDINGDGVDDVAAGDRLDVHVVFGNTQAGQRTVDADMLDAGQGVTWKLGQRLPAGTATGGPADVNGDGIDDLVINFDDYQWVYRAPDHVYADGETHVIFGRRAETIAGFGDIREVITMPEFQAITYAVSGKVPADQEGEIQIGATAHLPADVSVSTTEVPESAMQGQTVEFELGIRNNFDVEAVDVAIKSVLDGLTDVTWRVEEGYTPVREIYKLDESQVQSIDEAAAVELLAAASKLPWDYDGDGVESPVTRSNLERIFSSAGLSFNEHTIQAALGDIDDDGFDDLVHVGSSLMAGETGP